MSTSEYIPINKKQYIERIIKLEAKNKALKNKLMLYENVMNVKIKNIKRENKKEKIKKNQDIYMVKNYLYDNKKENITTCDKIREFLKEY